MTLCLSYLLQLPYFRATSITAYLENMGTIEKAQAIAAHEIAAHDQTL
jgi:hypothetical protein